MESIWEKSAAPLAFGTLNGDKTVDVLLVGGGIAGVLCAYRLQQAGADCLLVEADRIGGGVTGRTTAKITLGHGLIYHQLIKRFGEDKARLYADAQRRAGDEYARLCREIDCDYETKDSYVYSLRDRLAIEREVAALRRLGIQATVSDARELPFAVAGAVRVERQAQFHPLKFLYAIADNLPVCEHTKVREFAPHMVTTDHGRIRFDKLIIATHFPIFNKHGGYFIKLYQHRSYVLALKGARVMEGMYVDEADTGLSFRGAPHRQMGWQLAGIGGLCQEALPTGSHGRQVGHPGLYDAGRHSVYWALRSLHPRCVCGYRLQQMGHDQRHGGSGYPL